MSRRTATLLLAFASLVTAALMLRLRDPGVTILGVNTSSTPGPEHDPVVAVIDADVPGTRVYLRGQLLGEVPLELTERKLLALGINPAAGPLDEDGWGEALHFGRMDEEETKLMLQVPDEQADRYLPVETPWGRRTKMGSWSLETQGGVRSRKAQFMPAVGSDGLSFRLRVPDRVARDSGPVRLELSCENTGKVAATWEKPEVQLLWGGFDTPWRRRCSLNRPLPAEWEKIAPGQTVRAVVEVDGPSVAGDYSVFACFSGKGPKGPGGHSDSRLLRVR